MNQFYAKMALFALSISLFYALITGAIGAEPPAMEKLRASAVHIAIGTGFIVQASSGKRYLMTNEHVCLHGNWRGYLEANYEGGRLVVGKMVKHNIVSDLCASAVTNDYVGLKIAPALQRNEQVYTRGYPYSVLSETTGRFLGEITWQSDFAIEDIGECPTGARKHRNGHGNIDACVVTFHSNVTNMYARPGSSGSPVVNSQGELIGVMSSWDSDHDAGGMVRLEDIKEFMKGL